MFLALLGQAYPSYISCYLNYGQIHVDLYKSDFTLIIRSRGTSYSEKGGAMMILYKKTKQTNVFIDVRFTCTTGQGANYKQFLTLVHQWIGEGVVLIFFSHGGNLEPKVVFPRAGENPIKCTCNMPIFPGKQSDPSLFLRKHDQGLGRALLHHRVEKNPNKSMTNSNYI